MKKGLRSAQPFCLCALVQAGVYGLKSLRENSGFKSLVPEGRLNLAQDDSPGLDLKRRPVPQGRLKIDRDAILNNLQPSLRDFYHVS